MSHVKLDELICLESACMDRYASLLPCQGITVCLNIVMLWQRRQLARNEMGWHEMRRASSTVPAKEEFSDVS